jgi:hypothetical protein
MFVLCTGGTSTGTLQALYAVYRYSTSSFREASFNILFRASILILRCLSDVRGQSLKVESKPIVPVV